MSQLLDKLVSIHQNFADFDDIDMRGQIRSGLSIFEVFQQGNSDDSNNCFFGLDLILSHTCYLRFHDKSFCS